ncbi:MAG: hypothetical protein R3E60_03615 [Alphaproteobacteria bacterium]
MFNLFKRFKTGACPVSHKEGISRICEVGWLIDSEKAGFIYGSPRPISRRSAANPHVENPSPKGVNYCPAIIDVESKTFEIPCPVDLQLALRKDEKGQLRVANVSGPSSTINRQAAEQMVHLLSPNRWRAPNRPVIQIGAPYRFITDEPVWMTQIPAYNYYRETQFPGLLIGGRFPIDVWPRTLMWAFEWHDPTKVLRLQRGEPWFYVRFETFDPSRPVKLVEAVMTPELREHCKGLDAVTNYVNRTFNLFTEARARRPAKLLTKAQRPNQRPIVNESIGVDEI